MKPSAMHAILVYNGQEFRVEVESIKTEHVGFDRPNRDSDLYSLGVDGRRWIIDHRQIQMTRVIISGIITLPPRIELPFIRRDRFTLAELLPKHESDDSDDADINDWD